MNNGSAVAELYRWQGYCDSEREACHVLSGRRHSGGGGGGPTFTWILMGRGIPSFRSLVLSLKSLQNWPMGIPLWEGDKHKRTQTHKQEGEMMDDLFKMYEKPELEQHSRCHTA